MRVKTSSRRIKLPAESSVRQNRELHLASANVGVVNAERPSLELLALSEKLEGLLRLICRIA